ncbi:MAG: VCBS repeat-containing protein, partial [Candidatus Zixiibacteriota bacterium]
MPGLSATSIDFESQILPGDSARFQVTFSTYGQGECDIGTYRTFLEFYFSWYEIGMFEELYVPVAVTIGITTSEVQYDFTITDCILASHTNTAGMWDFNDGSGNLLYDASLLVGLVDGDDTTVYRDIFEARTWAPVDDITAIPGSSTFEIASEDARIQGYIEYTYPVSNPDTCGFIIAEYVLTNKCDTALDIVSGLACDFDIFDAMTNYALYNSNYQMITMTDETWTVACGIGYLSGPNFEPYNMRAMHNPDVIWDGKFKDGVAYTELINPFSNNGSSASDWSILQSFGTYRLAPGDTARYKVALLYSDTDGEVGLRSKLNQAKAWLNIQPRLVSVGPSANDPGFPRNAEPVISASFDQILNAGSVNENSFAVSGSLRGIPAGSYGAVGSSAVLDIAYSSMAYFKAGERVTTTFTTDIKTAYGVPVESGYSWSFTVGADSGGAFGSKAGYSAGNNPRSVCGGDLDDDGDIDIVVANRSDNSIKILENNGDGTYSDGPSYATGDGPNAVAIADFGHNGIMYIIT